MSEWQQSEIPFDVSLSSVAEIEDNPAAYRHEYPYTIEQQRDAFHLSKVHRELMKAVTRSEPYFELGGNIPEPMDHLAELGEYLDDSDSDKHDIVDSFERLDILHSLDVNEYEKMTKDDKKHLALHMVNHLYTLKVRAGVIGADGGYMDAAYSSYEFTSQDEAQEYSQKLFRFAKIIEATAGYKAMEEELDSLYPTKWRRAKSVRAEYKNHSHRLYVVRDTKSNKLRVHIENSKKQPKPIPITKAG